MISAQVEQLYESSSGGGQSVSHIQQDESSFAPDHSPGARLHEHVNTKIERAVTAERQPNSQPGLPKLCVSNSLKATTRFDRDYEKLKISAEKACTRKSLFWLELESLMAKMFGHAEKIALNNHFLYHTSRDKLLSSVVAQGSWESQLATRSHWMECGIRESDPVKEYLVRRCVSGYRSRDITDTALLMVDFKGIPQGSHDWGDILRSYMVIVQRETDIDVMNISIIEVPTDDAWHDTEPAIQSLKTNFIHPKSGNRVSMRDTFSYCSFLHHQDEYDVLVITFLPDSVTATIYQPFGGRDSKRGFIQQSIMGFISSQVRREKCRSPEVNMVFTTSQEMPNCAHIRNATSSAPMACLFLDTWVKTLLEERARPGAGSRSVILTYEMAGLNHSFLSSGEEGRLRWAIWKVFERERELCERLVHTLLYSKRYLGLKRA